MENKNKSITVYFHNDMDLFDELMKMNKFYRSQFIRDSVRKALNNTDMIIQSAKPAVKAEILNKDEPVKFTQSKTISEQKEYKVNKDIIKDDNDPMSIL